MLRKVFLPITIIFCLLLYPCYVNAGHIKKRKIKKLFKHSAILNNHFTGFALYDLDNKKMVYEYNDDKYFIPASNTKLFTYYTCLKILGDSIPALKYVVHGDSLIFWGTGDPSFLHSALKGTKAFNYLSKSGKQLYYANGNYKNEFYGEGWSWDNYNDYYQAEITELPIEDNVAVLYADKNDSLQIRPSYLKRFLKRDSNYSPKAFRVKRDFLSNSFIYPPTAPPGNFRQEIPWKTNGDLNVAILQDTLKKPFTLYVFRFRKMQKHFTMPMQIRFTNICCSPATILLPNNCCWFVRLLSLMFLAPIR